ncbi:MAG: hypothetical protein M1822_004489 [Bathelium mastoideum]|nr:MAG: hypothetical protein M1822_004489 [Bathelium mastoideum]
MTILEPKDTHVIMACCPGYGHMRPLKAFAVALRKLGYPITFISSPALRATVESIGVEFIPWGGKAAFCQDDLESKYPERQKLAPGPELAAHDVETFFIGPIVDQHIAIQSLLSRPNLRDKKAVIVSDAVVAGVLPPLLGAPGHRVPVISVGSYPIFINSKDTAPFGMGLQSQGEESNIAMNEAVTHMFKSPQTVLEQGLKQLGCTQKPPSSFPFDNFYLLPDLFLQLCVPSFEPPRRDLPSNLRFIGTILGCNDSAERPAWFDSFVTNDTARPLVIVTSGSLPTMTSKELIEPTLLALADLPVRVVACTVAATLPPDFALPANARAARWIPFEALLPHADAVVSNGGYGAVSQALAAGVPLVVAGVTEDKAENAARVGAVGAGVDLRTQTPTAAQVREAVLAVLLTRGYRRRARELKEEYARYDAVGGLVQAIEEVTAKAFANGVA